ncbi:MAG TPA: fumarate hydratase [Opitutaceae bacterium]|jgi:fumarate hydratase class I|nr:fumarate hydratase [Opitutaceae bacterium]
MPPPFIYQDPFPLEADETDYRLLTRDGVRIQEFEGGDLLRVDPAALSFLAQQAFHDCSFYLRTSHLVQVAAILADPEASDNDRYVATTLLRNAEIAAGGILPMCQDTGTAAIVAKKGERVWTGANDAEWLSRGVYECYTRENLRYSQTAPLDMWKEVNTGTNLPAQIDISAVPGAKYEFLFAAKGGGSANKMLLFQETKALLNPKSFEHWVADKLPLLGTAACPPYHLVFVVGGTSAETCMKVLKLASARALDSLPGRGNEHGQAFRDREWEDRVLQAARKCSMGSQFGGRHFALDVRVVRLPRHGASCPVAMGVSCSADRHIKAKITPEGIFIERLETEPGRFLPAKSRALGGGPVVALDLNRPMEEIRAELSRHPVTTRVSLNGPMIVARDIAHAKLKERVDAGRGLPQYFKDHPVYYAGPAKTPAGYNSGSFGPTTAGRMDSYVDQFQSLGGSMVMLAKGNRGPAVTAACCKHGGFYLGSIGGAAAVLASENIRKVEVLEYPELGMEAIWKIQVQNFPAFIVVDDKGNDFFAGGCGSCLAAKP